jgi:uncharacterized membrane protein
VTRSARDAEEGMLSVRTQRPTQAGSQAAAGEQAAGDQAAGEQAAGEQEAGAAAAGEQAAGEREAGAAAAGEQAAGDQAAGSPAVGEQKRSSRLGPLACPAGVHVAILIGYLAAGIAVNGSRATYLTGHRLPTGRDTGLFVWDFWWMARSVLHFSNPWSTHYLAAPVGTPLGFHTLMPLPGVLMTPVTVAFGPTFTYNLLAAVAPGLMCYAMYRAARLWLPSQIGAIAAGAFFGLSTMMTWNAWFEPQLALGGIFLPLALEAAVRLGRRPGWRQAAILGVVLGAALLTDQESAILAGTLAALALLPWLVRRPSHGGDRPRVKLRSAALAAAVTAVVASPQIIAMIQQARAGDASVSQGALAADYRNSGAPLQQIFSPSPRVGFFGLKSVGSLYLHTSPGLTFTAYGWVLIALALFGLVACWRRRSVRLLGLLWLGATIAALGTGIVIGRHRYVPLAEAWHGIEASLLLPYTWMVRISLLSSFREANRITELGLVPAALLAAAAVDWLRSHARPAMVAALALAVLEAGSVGVGTPAKLVTMPTALPALDRPIAADHSRSIVVDVPFGVRSAVPLPGEGAGFNDEAEVLATADGHPRTVAYISRLPESILAAVKRHPFYASLLSAQQDPGTLAADLLAARQGHSAWLEAARRDARRIDIGWAIVWSPTPVILDYLQAVGLRFDYRADGALVYRMPPAQPGR